MVAPANDNWADAEAVDVTAATGTITGDSTDATTELGEDVFGDFSVWYRIQVPITPENDIIEFTLDSTEPTYDSTLRLYENAGSLLDLAILVSNDQDLDRPSSNYSRLRYAVDPNTDYFLRVGGDPGSPFTIDWAWYPAAVNNLLSAPASLIAADSISSLASRASTNAFEQTNNPGDLNAQGVLWYTWNPPGSLTDPPTFSFTAGAGTTAVVVVYAWNPDGGVPPTVNAMDYVDGNLGETAAVTLATWDLTKTYYIAATSYNRVLADDYTLTWDQDGDPPATPAPDPTATGQLGGEATPALIMSAQGFLSVRGAVTTTDQIISRPVMSITLNMPEPAMLNGQLVSPDYWGHYPSDIDLTLGSGHIRVVPDADPGDGDDPDWPDPGPPDYWWTIKDLDTPDPGEPVDLATWPEHFGGPPLKSSGIYRPSLQRRDNFGPGGRKHTYTKAVVFDPDDVNHMWVDLGSNLPQPYTVMMAGIILSYPTRTYGHYLMDAGRPTPLKNPNKDWRIDDNLSYRSLMLFQLHSALVCSRPVVEDGVYARVTHNYVNRPRVFLGIFNGRSSKVGWMDTKEKKVATGRTDNNAVRRLVIGRRQDNISDNLASHMTLFETRIWRAALTPAQYRAQYKQMAGIYKFNKYEKDGL